MYDTTQNILHVHSMYSLHDSTQTPEEIVLRAKELGCENITLTDHGTLWGIDSFLQAGNKYGLNAIPGVEAYLEGRRHLILLAKDYSGYQAIVHAMRDANSCQEKRKKLVFPIMEKDTLLQYFQGNEHVVCTSACINGPISYILLGRRRAQKQRDKLEAKAEKYRPFVDQWPAADKEYKEAAGKEKELKKERTGYMKYTKDPFANKIKKLKQKLEKLAKDSDVFLSVQNEIQFAESTRKNAILQVQSLDGEIASYAEMRKKWKKEADDCKKKKEEYRKLHEQAKSILIPKEEDVYQEARECLESFKKIFPHFLIEVQYHGLEEEAYVMPLLVKLAHETDTPLVAANDAHMTSHNVECITARKIVRFNYFGHAQEVSDADKELYIKSNDELFDALAPIIGEEAAKEAIRNTDILNECHVVLPDEKHYPKAPGGSHFDEIIEKERAARIAAGEWTKAHEERLRHEISVIKQMGYVDYHMIVRDFCNMARKLGVVPKSEIKNIPVDFAKVDQWLEKKNFRCGIGLNPGRGSAVGSLVCNLLGITLLDPVRYHLLFERYLNPERVSMPDIDTDIKTSLRPVIIRYIKWNYGEHAVCSIGTETRYEAKGAVQMAGRERKNELYGKNPEGREYYRMVMQISDLIPEEPGASLAAAEPDFLRKFGENEEAQLVWEHAKLIEGKLSGHSVHAGGVVISDNSDVNDYLPLSYDPETEIWASECDMVRVEEKGMLKMDVLGSTMADCISDCLNLIDKYHGKVIDIHKIPFEKEVFQNIFAAGATNSIFQCESQGMKSMFQDFKPDCIEDVVLLVACYRPGPMQYLKNIIQVKNGAKDIEYATPELEPILKDTYGSIVYQEQVMQIFQSLAGYSLGQADLVRRAMSKKKEAVLKKEREAFIHGDPSRNIEGCVHRGIKEEAATGLFDDMIDFAKYAFNRSHAAAYAVVAYQTAWLKYHYPAEYLCAMLNNKSSDKYGPILEDILHYGITLLPLDINKSFYDFVLEDGDIRFGFRGVKGIADAQFFERMAGQRSTRVSESPYLSVADFLTRMTSMEDGEISCPPAKIMGPIIRCGAFDQFVGDRKYLLDEYDSFLAGMKKISSKEEGLYAAFCHLAEAIATQPGAPDQSYNSLSCMELMGCIPGPDPLGEYLDDAKYGCIPISGLPSKGNVTVFGCVMGVKPVVSKKGNQMLIADLRGKTGTCKIFLMNELYEQYVSCTHTLENRIMKVKGSCKQGSIFARKVSGLSPRLPEYELRLDSETDTDRAKDIFAKAPAGTELCVNILFYYKVDKTTGNYVRIKPYLYKKQASKAAVNALQAAGLKIRLFS